MEYIKFQSLPNHQLVTYQDADMAILKKIHDLNSIVSDDVLLDCYMFAMVAKGHAQLNIDDHTCNLSSGDMIVCKPKRILNNSMLSMDFDAFAIVFHSDYVSRMVKELNAGSILYQLVDGFDVVHCEPSEFDEIKSYVQLLCNILQKPDSKYKKKSIDSLFCSWAFATLDLQLHSSKALTTTKMSSSERIFDSFYKLLNDEDVPYQNVQSYAERLNITSKYLSFVCKKQVGKTASQLINEEIIHTAQVKLRDNRYNIQQIANSLGFTNQSHFGVFFHRHTGVSPQKYRKNDL